MKKLFFFTVAIILTICMNSFAQVTKLDFESQEKSFNSTQLAYLPKEDSKIIPAEPEPIKI